VFDTGGTIVLNPGWGVEVDTGVRTSFRPGVRTSFRPGVRTSFRPGVRTSFCPGVRNSFCPGVRTSFRPGVRTSFRTGVRILFGSVGSVVFKLGVVDLGNGVVGDPCTSDRFNSECVVLEVAANVDTGMGIAFCSAGSGRVVLELEEFDLGKGVVGDPGESDMFILGGCVVFDVEADMFLSLRISSASETEISTTKIVLLQMYSIFTKKYLLILICGNPAFISYAFLSIFLQVHLNVPTLNETNLSTFQHKFTMGCIALEKSLKAGFSPLKFF
jgi:hypothetical protein